MNFNIEKELTFIHAFTQEDTNYNFYLAENAQLNCFFLADQGSQPLEINIYLQGRNARAICKQLVLLSGEQSATIKTTQHHQAPNTQSEVIIKSILADSSRLEFSGLIAVSKEGKGTQAVLTNKNILLSSLARAVSEPQLEVQTNDVQCKHGSAVSRLDQNHILYLQSRGMCETGAKQLLLEGFMSDVVKMMGDENKEQILLKLDALTAKEQK